MNNKQLFIHEYNAGSGKSFSMINLMNRLIEVEQADLDVLISVPTKKLQNQYLAQISNALVLNEDTCGGSVTQYIINNQNKIQNTRIVIITHACLISNGNMFGERCLVIDELPTGIININSIQTTKTDSELLVELLDKTDDEINKIIKQREEGSVEYSSEKIDMLKASANNQCFGYVRTQPAGEYDYFSYLYYVDTNVFANFEHIHLMGANLKKSNAIAYFTKLCGYDLANLHPSRLNIRGNAMKQRVRIVPLLKFEGERDFISKDALDEHFGSMLDVVKSNSNDGIIIATNNRHHNTVTSDKHFKLISVKSHGLNCYKDQTQAAILYSANPNPMLIPFMKHCATVLGLPEDYLVDSYIYENVFDVVYQTVTRTAIRNPDYTGELTFFVPDQRCAEFLNDRFENGFIDWSLAVTAVVTAGGAPTGNTNKLGKGCPVVALLVKAGTSNQKSASLIKRFTNDNGFKPNDLEPSHMVKLISALNFKRLPKDYCFKV
ncbi:DEAD/DEAH box helicase family protein [Shewanella sp. M-Br]|uniref:DEAD/DEAH box helicase family protein n=1 Tax=Shewanella sp. M-Br TaxID=2495595 RepID=UPI0029492C6F|nr:hypothetical protein SMBr_32730 [Shewanella sp. M-Br]